MAADENKGSGTPLVRKLGFKPGARAHYVNAPAGFDALLGELPRRGAGARTARGWA
jgi:hypothetical protein